MWNYPAKITSSKILKADCSKDIGGPVSLQEKRLKYYRGKLTWKVEQHWKNVSFSDEISNLRDSSNFGEKQKRNGKAFVWDTWDRV